MSSRVKFKTIRHFTADVALQSKLQELEQNVEDYIRSLEDRLTPRFNFPRLVVGSSGMTPVIVKPWEYLSCDAGTASVLLKFPPPSADGLEICVRRRSSSGSVVIYGVDCTIDGNATETVSSGNLTRRYVSDSGNWWRCN